MVSPMRLSRVPSLLLAATVLATVVAPGQASAAGVVISQVYGGGGNAGATFTHDFIEIFNAGPAPADVTGWSIQYASSSGTTWLRTNLTGITLQPGQYYLVQQAAGAAGTVPLPVPDAVGTTAMSATAGKVALVASTTTLAGACPTGLVDLVGYGASTNCFEGSPAPGLGNPTAALRADGGCTDRDVNALDFAAGSPAPRNSVFAFHVCGDGTPTPPPTATPTPTPTAPPATNARIREIQGAGHVSPLVGAAVQGVTGIVTAKRANGFYMQDPSPDADDATSEGIFVFTSAPPTVEVGDAVRVAGRVAEFRAGGNGSTNLTLTELTSPVVAVESAGQPLPPAAVIGRGGRVPPADVIDDDAAGSVETSGAFEPATDGIDFYESLEGMRVQIDEAVVVGPRSDAGDIPVLANDGLDASVRTTRQGIAVRAGDFNPERLHLGDAITPLPQVNVGDHFTTSVVGPMDYSGGNFKIEVTSPLTVIPGALLPESAAPAGPRRLSIATFNVENLDPRDDPSKFATLARLIVVNLGSPDVVAIEEVQDDNGPTNDPVVSAGATYALLQAAIAAEGGPSYDVRQIDPQDGQDGGEPGGNIRQAFLFRTDRGLAFVDRPGGDAVTPTAVIAEPSGPRLSLSPGRIDPLNPAFGGSRKPLAGEFTFNGRTIFVVANHFNSKGGDQPLFGRFQPPVRPSEAQRRQQGHVVADFVRQILAVDANAAVVVLGDINDFEFSDTAALLKSAGLTDLIETLPPSERYTYVFEGNSQALDHTLVSASLATQPLHYDVVHVNAEFATSASDHDPQVAHLTLGVPPAITSAPITTATQGIDYVYQVVATGRPQPTFALDLAPALMTIDPATGLVHWPADVAPGTYDVVVRASNGVIPDAVQAFTVAVAPSSSASRVRPFVDCIVRGSGVWAARFGYVNPNTFPVGIAVGRENRFLPPPNDRRQTTLFEPGTRRAAFDVPFSWKSPVLAWILDGRVVVASPFFGPTCR